MNKIIKSLLIKILIIVCVIALDIITKVFFFGQNLTIIPMIIGVRETNTLNTGGAWGFLSDNMWILIVITIMFLIAVVLLEIFWKNTNLLYSFSLAFIVGGTIGNFIDRLFLGGVRDFIFFIFAPSYPTFNLADSFLCVGMVLLAIYILFVYKDKDKGKNTNLKEKKND